MLVHRNRDSLPAVPRSFQDNLQADHAHELIELIRSSASMMRVLRAVRDEQIPDAWIGAGVLRDLVWGERYGAGFSPDEVRDVDVAFFDPHDLSRANDDTTTERLQRQLPAIPWEAKNQAAVHTWYPDKFGGAAVEPLTSIHDAVGTWPETATAVAVRLGADGLIKICAPLGIADLLDGVWRRNPRRVDIQGSLARLARHQPATRWSRVSVIPPGIATRARRVVALPSRVRLRASTAPTSPATSAKGVTVVSSATLPGSPAVATRRRLHRPPFASR